MQCKSARWRSTASAHTIFAASISRTVPRNPPTAERCCCKKRNVAGERCDICQTCSLTWLFARQQDPIPIWDQDQKVLPLLCTVARWCNSKIRAFLVAPVTASRALAIDCTARRTWPWRSTFYIWLSLLGGKARTCSETVWPCLLSHQLRAHLFREHLILIDHDCISVTLFEVRDFGEKLIQQVWEIRYLLQETGRTLLLLTAVSAVVGSADIATSKGTHAERLFRTRSLAMKHSKTVQFFSNLPTVSYVFPTHPPCSSEHLENNQQLSFTTAATMRRMMRHITHEWEIEPAGFRLKGSWSSEVGHCYD